MRAKKHNHVYCMTANGKRLPEYDAWRSMRARCINKNHHAYKDYGGRGIRVCARWINSFQNFISYMGFRPSKRHTLDRLKNSKNYTPSNCAWRTMKEQCRNRRNNTWIEYNGVKKTKQEWADYLGINKTKLRKRSKKSPSEIIKFYINDKKDFRMGKGCYNKAALFQRPFKKSPI